MATETQSPHSDLAAQAVIGPNARTAQIMGSGSSQLNMG